MLRDEKKQHPERVDVYSILTRLYVATDNDQKGLEVLEELFKIDENNIEGLRIKGALEVKLGLTEQAIETFNHLATINPTSDIYTALGECYCKLERYSKSISSFNKALVSSPKNAKITFLLARSFMGDQQFSKAFNGFLIARSLKFNQELCNENLTQCLRSIRARHQTSKLIAS
jgi:tetratricopeptide (TPR) repeat protein